jgi:hypothetical protein
LRTEKTLSLRIDGNVRGSTNHTFAEQVAKGWNDVAVEDLAVAHAAFYLLTGEDLFRGNVVRAACSATLMFLGEGLNLCHYPDLTNSHMDDASDSRAASRSLPSTN